MQIGNKYFDTLNSHPLANDFNTLSIAAKVYYIVNRQGKTTTEQNSGNS